MEEIEENKFKQYKICDSADPVDFYKTSIGLDINEGITENLYFEELELNISFNYKNTRYTETINNLIKNIKETVEKKYTYISLYKFLKDPKKYYGYMVGPCSVYDIFEYIKDNNLSEYKKLDTSSEIIFLSESFESNIHHVKEIPETVKYFVVEKNDTELKVPSDILNKMGFTFNAEKLKFEIPNYNNNTLQYLEYNEGEDEGEGMF